MFAARSASRPALERLAMLLRRAYDDPAALSQLIVDADPAWLD
jgi:hypothetical protein